MGNIVLIVITCVMLAAMGRTAFAGDKRADADDTAMRHDPTGALVQAESFDAHAIEQGGKGNAIDLFNAHHPEWVCWPGGAVAHHVDWTVEADRRPIARRALGRRHRRARLGGCSR